jgi:hypothetical protein
VLWLAMETATSIAVLDDRDARRVARQLRHLLEGRYDSDGKGKPRDRERRLGGPRGHSEFGNVPMTEAECQAIRRSIRRNRPYGSEPWTRSTAARLGLLSSQDRAETKEQSIQKLPKSLDLLAPIGMSPWGARYGQSSPSDDQNPSPEFGRRDVEFSVCRLGRAIRVIRTLAERMSSAPAPVRRFPFHGLVKSASAS